MNKHIGILTADGDSPGLNAAIRAFGKAALKVFDMEVVGFLDGFHGLANDHSIHMDSSSFSGILTAGGTILGTSRDDFQLLDGIRETYERHHLDGLVCLGGRSTQVMGLRLKQQGMNVITLPKSITNHVAMTDEAIGFDSALKIAAESIDRLHSTAHSHHRIILVEIMGEDSGWLTLGAGIASGADVILIPEIPYDVDKVAAAITQRSIRGKRFSLVAVSEGAISQEDYQFFRKAQHINQDLREGAAEEQVARQLAEIEAGFTGKTIDLAHRLEMKTHLETRVTILGFLQRGGEPTAGDRMLATRLGTTSAHLAAHGQFGVMVASVNGEIKTVPLEEVAGKVKTVPLDHPWIGAARAVGTALGD